VCYHTPSYQAGADEHPDERLKHLALVMHARIAGTHETPELRILPVQCLLDLLELTLLMLRERHDASPTHLATGTCAVAFTSHTRFIFQNTSVDTCLQGCTPL